MKPNEKKFVCDIISLVANAVATGTIPEAQDYMQERYDNSEIIEHAFNVLTNINKRQYETFNFID